MSKLTKLTKFEKALLDTAKRLTTEDVVVVAVRIECWMGLSINTREKFNKYLAKLKAENSRRLNYFNEFGEQLDLPMNYDLNFPVRVDNIKCLDAIENYWLAWLHRDIFNKQVNDENGANQ